MCSQLKWGRFVKEIHLPEDQGRQERPIKAYLKGRSEFSRRIQSDVKDVPGKDMTETRARDKDQGRVADRHLLGLGATACLSTDR